MQKLFVGVAGLVLLGTVVMLFLGGVGAFDEAPRSEAFEPHALFGRGLFVLSLLAIGVAALARVPGRVIGLTALVTGLLLVQSIIAVISGGLDGAGEVFFGLHAINGVATIWVARTVLVRAREVTAAPAATAVGP